MAFDLATAKPAGEKRGFDLSTATPVGQQEDPKAVEQPQEDGFLKNTADVGLEFMSGANRAALNTLDFLGPDQVNAVLQLLGSDKRVPTLMGSDIGQQVAGGGFMEPGTARDIVGTAGELGTAAAGMVQVPGRNVATIKGAIEEILGAGSAAIPAPVKTALPTAVEATRNALPSKARDAAKLPLLRQSGDVAAAGFKLDDAGKVVRDAVQKKALKAGIDEGAVAMIASANKATKSRIKDMVSVLEKGRGNLEYRNFNTPQKVVGEAIGDRLKIIQNANRQAANQLDQVAKSLTGKPVDVSPAVNTFLDDLVNEGVQFNPKNGSLDFSDSTIEGLADAQNIIKRVVKRLYHTNDPSQNAYRVHNAKKFLDEQVSYGKTQAGLSGRMEGIVKRLRHNLDGILDESFPEYDRVNSIYAETRGVIDDLQGLAGKKVDLTGVNVDKALGTMSRKVLSNYNTGVAMEDLFGTLDSVARRYGSPLNSAIDDDLFKLVSTEAEIRKMFPSAVKPNTFQGEIGAEVARGAADATTGNGLGALRSIGKVAGKLFSKSDEDKLKALKDLVSEK